MSLLTIVFAIFGIGLLMAVHEAGHFFVARAFKMRVIKFSIGFGPVLWSKKPEGSATTYQIALLPFLAYVQIAGMNPAEEIDDDDKGSYANSSWLGRTLTIFAGPLANYLFAVVVFFLLLVIAGRPDIDGLKIGGLEAKGAAAAASVMVGDEVRAIDGKPVSDWRGMREQIQAHKGKEMTVTLQRGNETVQLRMTPSKEEGKIGIAPKEIRMRVSFVDAVKDAVIQPPKIAYAMVQGFGRLLTGKEKAELKGPVGLVQEASSQLKRSWEEGIEFFALLSIYICVFNLLPFPALDGGRLFFLLYEFVTRRRPNAKIEARIHMVGLLALLGLMVPLLLKEVWQVTIGKLF